MYLIVPLFFIVLSAGGIAYIIRQKVPYLKKLTPESHEVSDNILRDFFPEVGEYVNEVKIKEFQKNFLKELEKLVRRLRVVTLKVDHISDRVIKKLRHHHISTHLEHKALLEEKAAETTVEIPIETNSQSSEEDLKAREQQLIVKIAKNPKEAQLYIELGDLYLAMHNIGEAKESFEAALALNPHDLALARRYSKLLKKTEPTS